jgi:hypothetical protein
MLRRIGRRSGGRCYDRRAKRRLQGPRACRRRVALAGDTDRHAVALELDLGESGFVEQLR